MMILNTNMLGAWAKLGCLGKLQGTNVVFEDFTFNFWDNSGELNAERNKLLK
jgi:hypothetical protein